MSFMDQMAPGARARLEQVAEPMQVGAGSFVIRRGEEGGDFFRIERGTLEVVDTSARPEMILNVLGPGTVVGEMSFLTQEPRSVSVRAGEDSVLLRWRRDVLRRELDANPELASDFYRATALLLSRRLKNLTENATSGALGGGARALQPGDDAKAARSQGETLKADLQKAESAIRRAGNPAAGREILEPGLAAFTKDTRRLFESMSEADRAAAGQAVAADLQPYLLRSRLAELAVTRPAGYAGEPAFLAHIELAEPRGSDGLGRLVDTILLTLPSAAGHRARQFPMQKAVEGALRPGQPAKVLVISAGTGGLIARVGLLLQAAGGEITVVDADRDAIHLREQSAAPPNVKVRVVQEDLGRLALDRSESRFGPQDVVVINGLADYLPDRVLATLVRALRKHMAPGATLILDQLEPTPDHFLFHDILGWKTIRRPTQQVADLLSGTGMRGVNVLWHDGNAAVISAQQPG